MNGLPKFNHQLTFLGDHTVDVAGFVEAVLALSVLGICLGLWFLADYSAPTTARRLQQSAS